MGPPLGDALEFLSQALSKRGPDAVPYSESMKYAIREHVSELLKVSTWPRQLARQHAACAAWSCMHAGGGLLGHSAPRGALDGACGLAPAGMHAGRLQMLGTRCWWLPRALGMPRCGGGRHCATIQPPACRAAAPPPRADVSAPDHPRQRVPHQRWTHTEPAQGGGHHPHPLPREQRTGEGAAAARWRAPHCPALRQPCSLCPPTRAATSAHPQGAKYNIPIVVWLPDRFPVAPPLAYVTPTANMVVKQGHSYVDPSGLVW